MSFIKKVDKLIEESLWLLELKNNFDDEGSQGYDRKTWEQATSFFRNGAIIVHNKTGIEIDLPMIGPGPDGTIDFHWPFIKNSLLINVKKWPLKEATFSGNNDNNFIEGKIELDKDNLWLFLWLAS